MRILIAPDSFKECLPAESVARALARGAVEACGRDVRIDLCPMADGGEGTVAAMTAATGGELHSTAVLGPLGEPVSARWGMLGRTGPTAAPATAVIEMAAASGLDLVAADRRNPLLTTTFGTGQLIAAALDAGAGEIIIGIGGSATVDGGCGCAQALGVRFLDETGRPCPVPLAGGHLGSIHRVDLSGLDERIARTRILVACDVTNPLTGPQGAARVYGPQKGATPEMVERLEAGLVHLAAVLREQLGIDVENVPGAGAAGGLGGGLVGLLGGRLCRGVEIVAGAVALRERLAAADVCLTGEGSFDAQSLSGKTAVGVARLAREVGTPAICIPGRAERGLDDGGLFADVRPLVAGSVTPAVVEAPL
ncbi:MAG: glycerate kinase, partial [Planctomycetes bacterium]|nr:glycerate kinase [Planctomycetota bacterium]